MLFTQFGRENCWVKTLALLASLVLSVAVVLKAQKAGYFFSEGGWFLETLQLSCWVLFDLGVV